MAVVFRFVFAALACAAVAGPMGCGHSSQPGPGPGSTPAPTYTPAAKGTAQGAPASQSIGSGGGKVSSADGRLDLTVPAGALSAATQVTVQPITNSAPNALGGAFRLAPEGATFASPVTLTFHVPDVQAAALDGLFIATQHADGLWYAQPGQVRDANAKTISVSATHFSDWAVARTLALSPDTTRVRTAATATFTATLMIGTRSFTDSNGDELAIPDVQRLTDQIGGDRTWAVNGVAGGNTVVGTIAAGSLRAPNNVPSPSTVAVSLAVKFTDRRICPGGAASCTVTALAAATIFTSEQWSGSSDITQGDGSKVHADFTFVQKGDESTSGGGIDITLEVKSGQVSIKPGPRTDGCTLTLSPDNSAIAAAEGTMKVHYDLATGPDSPVVTGQGTTVWGPTYTLTCPTGTSSAQLAVSADWWPMPPTGPVPIESFDGVVDTQVSDPLASGTLHLQRQ